MNSNWTNSSIISEEALTLAYRKAKVDCFYEREHCQPDDFIAFERNFEENILALKVRLASSTTDQLAQELCGTWAVMPKSIASNGIQKREGVENSDWLISRSDSQHGPQSGEAGEMTSGQGSKVEFRLIGRLPVTFHVIAALWILEVGHLFDAKLSAHAYGSRLCRHAERAGGQPNRLAAGCFKPYLQPYKQWRDKSLAAMEEALKGGEPAIVVNADFSAFYHSIDPTFLTDTTYTERLGITLSEDQWKLTRIVIGTLVAWQASVRDELQLSYNCGLPVGAPVSRLIANVSLIEFDRAVLLDLEPLFYGRYVDDLVLVLRPAKGVHDTETLLKLIAEKSDILDFEPIGRTLTVQLPYLGTSSLAFGNKKTKVFELQGAKGEAFLRVIRNQMEEQSSEWRNLPTLPEETDLIRSEFAAAVDRSGEPTTKIRLINDVSVRKAHIAFLIRDAEACAQDLAPDAWHKQRIEFLKVASDVLTSPMPFFEMYSYVYRVVSIGTRCGDTRIVCELLRQIKSRVLKHIGTNCRESTYLAGRMNTELLTKTQFQSVFDRFCQYVYDSFDKAVTSAFRDCIESDEGEVSDALRELLKLQSTDSSESLSRLSLKERSTIWFDHDFGTTPFKYLFLPFVTEASNLDAYPALTCKVDEVREGVMEFLGLWLKLTNPGSPQPETNDKVLTALILPTRPFSPAETYLILPDLFGSPEMAQRIIYSFQGYDSSAELPVLTPADGSHVASLRVKHDSGGTSVAVGIASYLVEPESWVAASLAKGEPDSTRYRRLNALLNRMRERNESPDYAIFGELAIKPAWFMRAAKRFARSRISLISGVDYLHHRTNLVANEAWCSLASNCFGYDGFVVYRQAKSSPALHEEDDLFKIAGKRMVPRFEPVKPVITHGKFKFGVLICSELTDLAHRKAFRGNVDAIIVTEWNKDTDHFSSIVESSAIDVHAFIIQVNNRAHGDSRIRAPMKERYERDLVQVRGGIHDYHVTGKLDFMALRKFQSNFRSPEKPFKPVPDGFNITDRWTLPT